ncbi:MAG: type I-G CRISPR-associated helicase/endonuclease Cas3g [Pseudonocardiaceae bacterium]
MTLGPEDFPAFFAEVHGGHGPFRWQRRLLAQVLTGRWPDRIDAPTGAGKTAVIDVHVFAVALMAAGATSARVPRRLALVVDRRTLVDDQYEHARSIADRLKSASDGGALAQVARALRKLYIGRPKPESKIDPLVTGSLRGGLPASRAWRDDPVACAVINATPDMWGSRLLLRGYGASQYARPREAGLLARDSVVVVDEAHLARQLLCTARRVTELQGCVEEQLAVPALQVVETTATPSTAVGTTIGVEETDFATDLELARRLRKARPVRTLPLPTWPLPEKGSARTAGVRELAGAAQRLRAEFGATVGCLVNTVGVAVEVAKELRDAGLAVELLCGRLRPHDVAELRDRRRGLLTLTGNPAVDVLVATQTLEVGVDLDLHAMVTELAPGTALAQRAGRVNRLGLRPTAIEVVVPADPASLTSAKAGPYDVEDLQEALVWLRERESAELGLAPWALRDAVPPTPSVGRVPEARVPAADTWQFLRLELWDSWQLARTSDDLAAEPDLELWLSDDLEPDWDVGLLVRSGLDTDTTAAIRMLRVLPPRRHEVFPTPIAAARSVLKERIQAGGVSRVVLRVRAGDIDVLEDSDDLRPGDQLVVDGSCAIFLAGVVDKRGTENATDVLEKVVDPRPGDLALVLDGRSKGAEGAAAVAAAATFGEPTQRAARAGLAAVVEALAQGAAGRRHKWLLDVAALLRGRIADVDMVLQESVGPDGQHRVLIADQRRARRDDEARQTWTPAQDVVTLDQHQRAVAERAAAVGARLALGAELVEVLRLAGLHHDDGKSDPRFQTALKADLDGAELAKSRGLSPSQWQAAYAGSGLPSGWRHEQLSAALCWAALTGRVERDLVTRLVGTSHGRGRAGYPHTGAELSAEPGAAVELFDDGLWDEIVERTDRRFGAWGTAYLEALLRAADGQVSGEGS